MIIFVKELKNMDIMMKYNNIILNKKYDRSIVFWKHRYEAFYGLLMRHIFPIHLPHAVNSFRS